MKSVVFFDAEINPDNGQILDIGAVDTEQRQFHSAQIGAFSSFVEEYTYFGGHNIIGCDLNYLETAIPHYKEVQFIDTLFLSPLLFPAKPYHRLLKDDKLQTETLSNPLDDAVKSMELFSDEVNALTLEGGFLVLYQTMHIRRLEMDNRIQYKQEDYKQLNEYYKQKIQMIHIVGEYATMMVSNYDDALQFVSDYFQLDYKVFLTKYFKGDRLGEINRNITPKKYNELMGKLSDRQREIIDDDKSQYIVVAAGPGSGKTMLLVHKLAALVMLDDIKYEQLLMLTFSRAAATEFKSRLLSLIGNAARFIEIKTFHSYCFDLLGKVGSLEQSQNIVPRAVEMIRAGEVEQIRITKTIVVIDEAQDMDRNEYDLICALMECNSNMRIIAVGDDDQNIYAFRGSDSRYMRSFITEHNAKQYDLTDNYRSTPEIIALANRFSQTIQGRLKSAPIKPVRTETGIVRFIRHRSFNLEYPVVQNIISNRTAGKTICVLTWTNDEALRVNGLLREMHIPSRLIQSNDGFSLFDLAELRMFLKLTKQESDNPIISDEQWNQASVPQHGLRFHRRVPKSPSEVCDTKAALCISFRPALQFGHRLYRREHALPLYP